MVAGSEFDLSPPPQDLDIPPLEEIGDDDTNNIEKFAWYSAHHTLGPWGVFIREYGIHRYAKHIRGALWRSYGLRGADVDGFPDFDSSPPHEIPNRTINRVSRELAVQRLITHEWFHFQVEYLGYLLEDSLGDPVYTTYKEEDYNKNWPSEECIEESLANAFVARSSRCSDLLRQITDDNSEARPTLKWQKVVDETTVAPPAYEKFRRYTSNREFKSGCQELCLKILNSSDTVSASRSHSPHGLLGEQVPFDYSEAFGKWSGLVPLYIVPLAEDPQF